LQPVRQASPLFPGTTVRKIERHLRNVELFGQDLCPRQVEASSRAEYLDLVSAELDRAGRVGLRSDWAPGTSLSDIDRKNMGRLPFLHDLQTAGPHPPEIVWFWDECARLGLWPLVCETFPNGWRRCNLVAHAVDEDTVLVEWSEQQSSQRDMDRRALSFAFLGPANYAVDPHGGSHGRCYRPRRWNHLRFPLIYDLCFLDRGADLTATVLGDTSPVPGRVIIW
jgi:hypothetical protein